MRRMIVMMGVALAMGLVFGPPLASGAETPGDPFGQGIHSRVSPAVMARYDLDHDGVLNAVEKAALRKDIAEKVDPIRKSMLQQYDWNRNGKLDADERAAMTEARKAQHARAETRALQHFDANHDGTLDAQEQATRRERREAWLSSKKAQALQAFDANGNGLLDPGEKAAMRQMVAEGRAKALQMFDTNGDGRLDAGERAAATEPVLVERMSRTTPGGAGGAGSLSAATGGEVRSDGGGARLAVPAGALASDTRVTITPVPAAGETRAGDRRVLAVYNVAWAGSALRKPATLDLSYAVIASSVSETDLVIGRWTGDAWEEVGGIPASVNKRMIAPITQPGRYALMARAVAPSGTASVSELRFLSPTGATAGTGVDIAFALGAPGAVSVRIYDTAGRLVRNVARGQSMTAGQHVVRWDGTASDGRRVSNGIFLVRVEAPRNTITKKFSFIR